MVSLISFDGWEILWVALVGRQARPARPARQPPQPTTPPINLNDWIGFQDSSGLRVRMSGSYTTICGVFETGTTAEILQVSLILAQ